MTQKEKENMIVEEESMIQNKPRRKKAKNAKPEEEVIFISDDDDDDDIAKDLRKYKQRILESKKRKLHQKASPQKARKRPRLNVCNYRKIQENTCNYLQIYATI